MELHIRTTICSRVEGGAGRSQSRALQEDLKQPLASTSGACPPDPPDLCLSRSDSAESFPAQNRRQTGACEGAVEQFLLPGFLMFGAV